MYNYISNVFWKIDQRPQLFQRWTRGDTNSNFSKLKFSNEKRYNAQNAENFLASKGILVRGMSVYNLSNYLRVSLGTDEENLILIKELKVFLEKFWWQ